MIRRHSRFALVAVLAGGLSLSASGQSQRVPEAVFVILGTGGGPVIRLDRSQPANAVVVAGAVYLVDVGDGTQRQLVGAHLPLGALRAIFISHHHIDHDGGLAPLLVSRWLMNGSAHLPVIGPPGTAAMVRGIADAYHATELAGISVGGPVMPPIVSTVSPRDMASSLDVPTKVFEDENIRVLAITNDHYHLPPGSPGAALARSYAFRIEAAGRTIVYTGDTGPSRHVEALAKNADLLVAEVIDLDAMDRVLAAAANIPASQMPGLLAHMRQDHLRPFDVGALAAKASVGEVVLTHLSPGTDGEADLDGYVRGIRPSFQGTVHIARDLDRY